MLIVKGDGSILSFSITSFIWSLKNLVFGSSSSTPGNRSVKRALNNFISSAINLGKFASSKEDNIILSSSLFSWPGRDLTFLFKLPAIDNTVPNVLKVKS